MPEPLPFPPGFLWGVSTSAHQFEGGNRENQWWDWEQAPGRVAGGDRSGEACRWWEDAEADFDRARDMGLNALRLSIEWSRVEPEEGRWDEAALARYREMVEALRARGLRPWPCLHHFTNPRWFERRGAFLAPDAPALFARFAARVVEALGDLCTDWVTFNEPNVYANAGYLLGEFPPGHRGRVDLAMRAQLQLLRAHGAAYAAMHRARSGLSVGFTQNLFQFEPAREGVVLDRAVSRLPRLVHNAAFLHGLEHGALPSVFAALGRADEARSAYDFTAFNYYGRFHTRFDLRAVREGFARRVVAPGVPRGDQGAHGNYPEVVPDGLAVFARRLARMGKPVYLLETGLPDEKDAVRPWQIAHTARVLHAVLAEGIELRGCFYWSLVDNFEWHEGWALRFGLWSMNEKTQARAIRPSGRLYSAIATHNALRPEDVLEYAPTAYPEIFGE